MHSRIWSDGKPFWKDVQFLVGKRRFYSWIGSRRTGARWLSQVICKAWDVTMDQWEHRNGILHGVDQGICMQGIDAQIRAQYAQGSAFLPRDVRFFFRDLTPKPPSSGSSHTRCVAKTSLRGARTPVTTRKWRVSTRMSSHCCLASKLMTISGSHHPSHNLSLKRCQERSGWTVYYMPLHRRDNYLFLHATCSLPDGSPAPGSTTPSFCSGSANSATADKLKAFQALV